MRLEVSLNISAGAPVGSSSLHESGWAGSLTTFGVTTVKDNFHPLVTLEQVLKISVECWITARHDEQMTRHVAPLRILAAEVRNAFDTNGYPRTVVRE